MYGGATDRDASRLSDNELLDCLQREVHPVLRINGEPEFVRIYRWPRGIPQYVLNHGRLLDAVKAAEARCPGLVFAGNAYRGVGLNDCVVSARQAVRRICP
jgi:oxygen-dependent protoporphyrinogen oxidase